MLGRLTFRGSWVIAIVLAYLYVFPYFPAIQSANELPRVYLVKAIADDHTFEIDHGVQTWGTTFDVSRAPDGHSYSNKAPGSSLLVAPVYAAVELVAGEPSLGETMWLCRFVTGVVPTLLFAWLLWGFLARFAPDPHVRRLVVVAYLFGSMALTYSILYFSHQLAAVCLGSSWIVAIDVAERRRAANAMIAAGALAGGAILCDYQAAFVVVPLAIDIALRVDRKHLVRALVMGGAGAAVPIALLLYYHAACFGSPFRTGYGLSTSAHGHEQGLLGLSTPSWRAFIGSTLDPDNGLFTLAPWLLLAIPGAVTLARTDRRTAVTCGAVIVVSLWFISSLAFWRAGWEVGPRYIVMMLPFALPLVAAQLEAWRDRPLVIGGAAGLVVVGVVVYTASAMTFPYWIDYVKNPLYELTFRMLGDGLVAPNVLTAAGATGLATIVPFVALVAGVTGWAIQRVAGWRGLAIAGAIGAVVIGAYAAFPRSGAQGDKAYAYVRAAVDKL